MKKINKTFILLIICGFVAACEPAPSMMENRRTPLPKTETTSEKLTSLEREIRDMETADFSVIFVFKRKDGGVFDAADKKYLAANRPRDLNRLVSTDDEKAFVAGSNYLFPKANLEALQKRFIVEDHSKPIAQTEVTANTNTSINANKMQ